MKKGDQYHRWVEWSEEDQTYLGKCPDLMTPIHVESNDPVELYKDLCDLIDNEIAEREAEGTLLPVPKYYPARIELRKAA